MKISKKLLIVATSVVISLCLLVGGGIWYLSREPIEDSSTVKTVEEKKEPKKALFYKDLPEMTLNINDVDNKMISFVLVVGIEDEKNVKLVETYLPKIQHEIILLVKAKKYEYLSDYHNQVDFLSEINSKINEIIEEPIVVETLFSRILIN